jgi:NMT1 family protein
MTEERGATLAALRGRRVSIGPVGSGSHALLLQLLKRNEVDQNVGELLALPPQEAADNLLAGEIDAAATLSSWDAPVVQQLIADERVELLNMARDLIRQTLFRLVESAGCLLLRSAARRAPSIDVVCSGTKSRANSTARTLSSSSVFLAASVLEQNSDVHGQSVSSRRR